MSQAPAGVALSSVGVQLIDANGDGRTDLLVTQGALSGYYPLKFGGLWDRRSFQKYQYAPSFDLEDPEVRLMDLTGDGVTDVLRSGTRLECFFNDSHEGWHNTRWVERQRIEAFPNVNFSDFRVKLGDISGDGMQDIVLIYDGNVEYWPNLGYGNWGKRLHMEKSPRFPYGYDPKRILVGDVDGDGLADVLYVDDRKVTLWINQSGNRWSDPIEILGTPPVSDMDGVRLVDLLGSGISGVLWTRDAALDRRAHYFFLDLTGGTKPYLLQEMNNHMGAVTRVGYAPSTRDYLDEQKRPKTRWKTPLPFPVQVVARVELIDEISKGKLTTEYRYHHGYWDGAEREFRGFGMVEQFDTEAFEKYNEPGLHGVEAFFAKIDRRYFSAPTLTKTWFHQGPVGEEFGDWQEMDWSDDYWTGDPQLLEHTESVNAFLRTLPDRRVRRDALRSLRGSILRTELYALDSDPDRENRPYTVTESAYGLREECAPATGDHERLRIFFPHLLAQRTTQWERGDDPMTQFTFSDDYDTFGQPRQHTVVAVPHRVVKRQPFTGAAVGQVQPNETRILATQTRTEYAAPDGDVYIHDRIAHVRAFELTNPPGVNETNPGGLSQVLRDQAVAAEEILDEFRALLDSWQAGDPLPGDVRLIGHTANHYDGAAFLGRDSGKVGPYGALTRSNTLVFTNDELDAAYYNRRPIFLGGTAILPAGAPANFGCDLGYRLEADSSDGYHSGYYADTQRRQFDFQSASAFQQSGVVVAMKDPLGNQTTVQPDTYWLLPAKVTDAADLETNATYNYHVMQPKRVTDANGHSTLFRYTALGLLQKQFLQGRDREGGTEERPDGVYLRLPRLRAYTR